MNNFSWSKAIGYGILLWLIMFVVGAILTGLNIALGTWTVLVMGIIAALIAYSFSVNANPQNGGQAFGYGLSFAVIGLVLDYLITSQWQPSLTGMWSYWVGYILILFAPLTAIDSTQHTTTQYHA